MPIASFENSDQFALFAASPTMNAALPAPKLLMASGNSGIASAFFVM